MLPILAGLVLVFMAADAAYLRCMKRRGMPAGRFRALAAWIVATDLPPLISAVSGWVMRDNSTGWMIALMWIVWVWIAAVLPRMAYYLFALLRLRIPGLLLSAALAAVLIAGATAGRTRLSVDRVSLCSDRLSEGFDGVRIVQLSDIHLGTFVRTERQLGRLVDTVAALHPDLVVFTGDLVNIRCTELDSAAMRQLARLPAPVFSVTGNHDSGAYIRDTAALPRPQSLECLLERQRAMGWRVLNDETVYLHRGGDSISLSGIAYDPGIGRRRHDAELPPADLERVYRAVPDSLYNLTLVHLPQLWEQIAAAGYGDLTLAGHVHSMQMKIRIGRWVWSPASWLYERWSGRYERGGRTLYINDGTGCVGYPMRLGARPQITLLTLKRCE